MGQYVEIPVSFTAQGPVFSLDLAFRFDSNRLQFDHLTGISSGLQYLFYLNPLDSIWRLTSFHPNGLAPNTPVFNLRFFTSNNEACAYDFSEEEGYLNGDSSAITINGCMNNTGLESALDHKPLKAYPNPFSNELYFDGIHAGEILVFSTNGSLMAKGFSPSKVETSKWPSGMYFVRYQICGRIVFTKLIKNDFTQ
ncbi:MAG: T9SS type A sorting domain-containing protein [Bacteroidia bacterium]